MNLKNNLKWIKDLFHHHIYEIIDKEKYELYGNYDLPTSVFIIYVMRCKICGKIKRKKIKYF